ILSWIWSTKVLPSRNAESLNCTSWSSASPAFNQRLRKRAPNSTTCSSSNKNSSTIFPKKRTIHCPQKTSSQASLPAPPTKNSSTTTISTTTISTTTISTTILSTTSPTIHPSTKQPSIRSK